MMAKNQITIKLHYTRADNDYARWNAWMWTLTNGGKDYAFVEDGDQRTATMVVDGYTTTSVSFIVRKGQWEAQEFAERKIDVSTVISGTVHCYVCSGNEQFKVVEGIHPGGFGMEYSVTQFVCDNNTLKFFWKITVDCDGAFPALRQEKALAGSLVVTHWRIQKYDTHSIAQLERV